MSEKKKAPGRFDGPIAYAKSRKQQQRSHDVTEMDVDEVFGITKEDLVVKPVKASEAKSLIKKMTTELDKEGKKGKKGKGTAAFDIPGMAIGAARPHIQQAAVVNAMVAQAFAENGSPFLLVADQTEALHIGIPMYADPNGVVPGNLAFEYLLGMNVFPLGLFVVIIGPSASGKSTLGYEIMRYFYLAGGTYRLVDAESKFSHELIQQILREAYQFWQYTQVSNVESWQTALLRQWDNLTSMAQGKLKTASKALKNVGYTIPHMDLVDTISGKAAVEQQEDVEAAGASGRGYAVHAMSISGFLRAESHRIQFAPVSTVFVNQEKVGTDTQGRPTSSAAGGQSVKFQESIEIQMRRTGEISENTKFEGYNAKLSMRKNSMMPEREIHTRILTADVKTDAGYEVRTWFDWNWSLVKLLVDVKGRIKTRLENEGISVVAHKASDVQNTAHCLAIGVKAEHAVSWSTLGHMLHADETIREKLRMCLGISNRHVLSGDFRKQQTALLKKAGAQFTAEELSRRANLRPITSKAKARKDKAKKKYAAIDAAEKAEAKKKKKKKGNSDE